MSGQPDLNGFLSFFATKPRGFGSPWFVLTHQQVEIEMLVSGEFGDWLVQIDSIESAERGQGYASEALNIVCDLADVHGVTFDLYVEPFGAQPKLHREALLAWYLRHGFVQDDETFRMIRKPTPLREGLLVPDFAHAPKQES